MKATDHHRMEEDILKRREWLTEQVDRLLACEDADHLKFFTTSKRMLGYTLNAPGFADRLMEQLGDIDNGAECWVVQCLLAVGRGDAEQAALIYDKYLREGINAFAEKLILENLE